MIEQVCSLCEKSWSNYTGPSDHFKRVNLIFGLNGSGKSSLADGIMGETRGEDDTGNIPFYNREYISNSLLLEDHSELRGVKVDFGQHDIGVEKQIKEFKKFENEASEARDAEIEKMNDAKTDLLERISKIIDSVKGSLRIQQKRKDKPQEIIDAWLQDYDSMESIYPDLDFASFTGDEDLQGKVDRLQNFSIPQLNDLSVEDIGFIIKILETVFSDTEIPSQKVIEWLDEGITLHNEKRSCMFCGSDLDLAEIKSRVESYQQNKKAIAQQRLSSTLVKMQEHQTSISAFRKQKDILFGLIGKDKLSATTLSWIESTDTEGASLINRIYDKLNDMDSAIIVDASAFSSFEMDAKASSEIQKLVTQEITATEKQLDNMTSIVKGAIGYRIKTDTEIARLSTNFRDAEKKKDSLRQQVDDFMLKIKQLEDQKSDIADFKDFLNEVLSDLDLPFELDCVKDRCYILQLRQDSKKLTVEDLSEGERNLLALLFFFYSLYSDSDQQQLVDGIPAIVVDDPTSSMDSQNRFYVIELMRHLFESDAQVFILTHVWDDFCALSYADRSRPDFSLWEVSKVQNASNIGKCNANISPYKKLFSGVYRFSTLPFDDPDFDVMAVHMSNAMRRVLEEYLAFNGGLHAISSGKEQAIGEVLFPSVSWGRLSNAKKMKVGKLIGITNIFSHRPPSAENYKEVQECAKFMMNAIEEATPKHFHAMKM